jgi:HAE1 family hydrophobic/amphiphilic exporter-1
MKLPSIAVKNPVLTAVCFIAVVILGLFSYSKLSVDLLPNIETNSLLVMTAYPGANANDVENNISRPVENTLNSISNLKHITSSSKENVSIVNLEFEFGVDIDMKMNDVRDKLELLKTALPDDAQNPIIFKFGANDIPIIILSVISDESTNGLYKILDDKVANPLARINGVGTVSVSGTAQREINIYCDPLKMDAYGLTVEAIAQLVGMENRNIPGGNMDIGSNTYSLRVQGEFDDPSEMLDIVVGSREGKTIYLRDVARVEDALQERAQETYTNGQRGAMIVIQKQTGANTVNIAEEVRQKLPEIQKTLPSDVKLGIITDTSTNILNTMNSLQDTIIIILILVVLVVFIFLGKWRATVIILITIPISLIASLIYLFVSGNTLNIISLSSLSLAIGMVVDDSIVVTENVMTHLKNGSRPKQAAIFGAKEVGKSVVGSCLTMLAVFIPITMVSGMAGILFKQLGWMIAIIMTISMIAALTLIPMLASILLKKESQKDGEKKAGLLSRIYAPIDRGLNSLSSGYGRLLHWAVNHRTIIVVGAVAIFGATMLLAPGIKTEFFPTQDNGRINIDLELPVSTRQDIAKNLALAVNDEFSEKYPEIEVINFSVGQADADNAFGNLNENGTHFISFNITLYPMEERKRSMTQISDMMRKDLEKYTELEEYKVTAGGSGTGGESTVDVEIYGYDFAATDAIAAQLAEKLKNAPECTQVDISRGDYVPEIQVDFDREKLALNGLNVTTVAQYLRNRINGVVPSYYREAGEEYDIRIRYAPEYRESIDAIEDILVYNPQGRGIRVRDLGTVIEVMTPPTIERKDRERVLTVSAAVANGYALSDLVTVIQNVMPEIDMPSDVTYRLAGTLETQQETFSNLFTLLILIITLVFLVMAAQFGSFKDPFVIMFSLPFAMVGVILGLSVSSTPLSVMALIGVLMLVGIVAKNGIVLVDYIKMCRERGMSLTDAIVTAGKSRLRPVLMTTLTTVLGMLPMALGTGEGSEMWRAMGTTVAWGLSIGTLVTFFLIPVIYCIFSGRKEKKVMVND